MTTAKAQPVEPGEVPPRASASSVSKDVLKGQLAAIANCPDQQCDGHRRRDKNVSGLTAALNKLVRPAPVVDYVIEEHPRCSLRDGGTSKTGSCRQIFALFSIKRRATFAVIVQFPQGARGQ